jgi:hypothetical protein
VLGIGGEGVTGVGTGFVVRRFSASFPSFKALKRLTTNALVEFLASFPSFKALKRLTTNALVQLLDELLAIILTAALRFPGFGRSAIPSLYPPFSFPLSFSVRFS